ncbi:hypothetical protein [uncultured Sphingomonas sp.]|uniref:hypothetical protein n=1 Tax=uncultured Sphingomonas sp. TaxID=158754 RepID=UPI0025CD3D1C|nr:hypothetical protein [uncultured Sphingomonas sp.]
MADAARITGAPSRASGFSEDFSATRRAALGAMIAGAALALPALAEGRPAAAVTDWDHLHARMQAAKARAEEFRVTAFEPIQKKLDRVAPLPPMYFEVGARSGEVARYPLYPWSLDAYHDHVVVPVRESAAALGERWRAWEVAKETLGYDPLLQRFNELEDAWGELEDRLILMPAPHHAALLWKIARLLGPDGRQENGCTAAWCQEFADVVMEDAQRLLRSQPC